MATIGGHHPTMTISRKKVMRTTAAWTVYRPFSAKVEKERARERARAEKEKAKDLAAKVPLEKAQCKDVRIAALRTTVRTIAPGKAERARARRKAARKGSAEKARARAKEREERKVEGFGLMKEMIGLGKAAGRTIGKAAGNRMIGKRSQEASPTRAQAEVLAEPAWQEKFPGGLCLSDMA